MSDQLQVVVELVSHKVQFRGTAGDHPAIILDYVPPLGDDLGYTPLELLLMSLASCAGATIATLLRRMHKTVAGLTVVAHGSRRDSHPICFRQITLQFVLVSPDVAAAEMDKALRLAEDTYCPVWAMLKGNVEVKTGYTLREPES
jgi:putative redox protein